MAMGAQKSVAAGSIMLFLLSTFSARAAQSSSLVSGVVVSEADSRPVARAVVTVFSLRQSDIKITIETDTNGRFALGDLPAGNFILIASKSGFVTTRYGAKRAGSKLGVPIALTGFNRIDLVVRVPRAVVLSGNVLTENGVAIADATVHVHE